MKIVVIGTGVIVERFITAAQEVEGVTFVAVYSRSVNSGVAFAGKNGVAKVYTNLDEMLADPDIDFVYVASPNSLHFEHVKKSLHAGKNVICEKPFTSTYEEALSLSAIAKETGLFLFEAITTIYLPNYKILKEYLPEIGAVRIVQCNYSQYSLKYDKLLEGDLPNVFNPKYSGGTLMDLNIYNLHFVLNLFGQPKRVSYFPNLFKNGIDTSGTAILEYSGFICDCTASKDSRGRSFVTIQGEKGYIHVDGSGSLCRSIHVSVGGRECTVNEQAKENILYYEIFAFQEMFSLKDFSKCYESLDYTCTVMKTVEDALKSGGILF
ncbi:MAG: Gfo/Idh/MocA family oxidoreductase [Thiovulaceae bacterium]|nr:Gfo/Idh/MocA family oxidoreductase [Sulfurimonadaceae bacterium]